MTQRLRFGIFLATWGSAMTRLVHRRKSPTDPVLYVIGNLLFSHHAFHLPPEVIKQLRRRGESVRAPGINLRSVPMIVGI